MKNRRNKQLTLFMEALGVLSASLTEQEAAKKAYRKMYMLDWKKTAKRKHEVRIMLTDEEYAIIAQLAQKTGFKTTTFMRELALKNKSGVIPNEQELRTVLQKVRMARFVEDSDTLIEIEQLLLEYLHKHA